MSAANAFALLDDEGTVDAGQLAAKLPVTKKEGPTKTEDRPSAGGAARGGRTGGAADRGRGGRGGRGAPRDSGEQGGFDSEIGLSGERSHGGGRGGARGGRGRPRSAGERAGKREFDRHDASGRGHETEKRHGGGRGNWGAEGEEIKDVAEKTLGEEAVENEGEGAAMAEEEEKQLTLEEYEALLSEKRAGLNVQRDAAYKADDAQFQGMKTFEKIEEDVGLGLNKNTKTIGANKGGRERGRKERELLVDVGFRVQTTEERGGGRGGDRRPRGGGRAGGRSTGGRTTGGRSTGGRSAGGREGRGPRPIGGRGAPINMEDTSAFPSLG